MREKRLIIDSSGYFRFDVKNKPEFIIECINQSTGDPPQISMTILNKTITSLKLDIAKYSTLIFKGIY